MKQAIAFYRKKNVNDVSVTHGGVTYESKDMLLHSPGQTGLLQPVGRTHSLPPPYPTSFA